MNTLAKRVASFKKFPSEYMDTLELAQAGFFFIGHKAMTMCFWCDGLVVNWVMGSNPIHSHISSFPHCDYAKTEFAKLEETYDAQLGPMRYAAERLKTYASFPLGKPSPEDLTNAGFFFTNFADCVKCFFCGGEIQEWRAEDYPFQEHGRLFPNCKFAKNYYCGGVDLKSIVLNTA